MTDNRKYDRSLVEAIRGKQHVIYDNDLPILLKPIPDIDREHVLDPRVKTTVERKRAMFAQRAEKASECFRLSNERFRSDKITFNITNKDILEKEQLIDVFTYHLASCNDTRRPAYIPSWRRFYG